MATQPLSALLGPDDPAPVVTLNTETRSPFLFIGDHAGIAIPAKLATLGVSAADLQRHIASDIGVRALGEALSVRLGAPFIHQSYSRLVIDCNRDPGSAEAIPARSDGTEIPGNIGLNEAERRQRVDAIHMPYQQAIGAEIARREANGEPIILISLHSFAPALTKPERPDDGRPWHIGILHGGGDARFARRVLDELAREPALIVGDNEPYRMDETDHSVPRHAFAAGIRYAEIEVRQDLIADPPGQRHWCELIAAALSAAQYER